MPRRSTNDLKPADHAGGLLCLAVVIAAMTLAAGTAYAAEAQLRVEGRADAVQLEVRDVPLRDVLDALADNFELRYRSNDALDARKSGSFRGSLRQVAARLLDGYDFAMKVTPQGIDVLVLRQGQRGDVPIANAKPARAPVIWPGPVMTAQQANRYERANSR